LLVGGKYLTNDHFLHPEEICVMPSLPQGRA